MTKKNHGLKIAEKIIFILAAVLFFASSFLPLSGSSSSSLVTSIYSSSTLLLSVFGWALFTVGFAISMFNEKKYAVGMALFVAQPIYSLTAIIGLLISESLGTPGVGMILLFVAVVLIITSIVLHSIASLVNKVEDEDSIEKRIAILKTFKEYKDEGIITEEEFQAKKEEVLGLKNKK